MWQRVIEPLSTRFRAMVIDLPGFGESGTSSRKFSTEDHANFLCYFLKVVGIQKAIFAGVSYGAQVAVTLAHQHPERVEKLILIAGTGLSTPHSTLTSPPVWTIFSALAKSTVLRSRWLMCLFGSLSFYRVECRPSDLCKKFYQQLSKPGSRDAWLNMLRNIYRGGNNFSKKLSELHVPTMIVWGEHDRTVPARLAAEFHRLMPTSILKIFPDCAHSVPLEKPQELHDAIIAFNGNPANQVMTK